MDRATELAIIKRAYAKQVLAEVQVDDPRVEAACAAVPREHFLGPGPWVIARWIGGFRTTPSADPVYVYTDSVVQILAEQRINNGQPSIHAKWIASAAIKEGDHVVHVGTGTGYYTAIMAYLAGPAGKVTGIECDRSLAERARANLSSLPHVQILEGDGAVTAFDDANVIYVNAGVTRPADAWLDGLAEGGRLILPLSMNTNVKNDDIPDPIERRGAVFRIEYRAPDFTAMWISPVAIIPCESTRDRESEAALAAAFTKGGWERVTRLRRSNDLPQDHCWLCGPGWSLTYS
jgi:protein-L-isoaspartate(D-aspartate) O-methyltransferase